MRRAGGSYKKHRVAKAYPKYAAQVAVYQAYMQLTENPAIFTALNADTEIHVALVPFDQELAQASIDRAAQIINRLRCWRNLPRGADSAESFSLPVLPIQGCAGRDTDYSRCPATRRARRAGMGIRGTRQAKGIQRP